MGLKSQQRRLARRMSSGVAKHHNSLDVTKPSQTFKCGRCSVSMAEEGIWLTFWYGVGRKRAEVTRKGCPACAAEVRKAGPGGSIGMHGKAYIARTRANQRWMFPKVQLPEKITDEMINEFLVRWAAWELMCKQEGRPVVEDSVYAILAACRKEVK